MNIIILKNIPGLNQDGWGIEIGREHTESYFWGLFKKTTIKWTLFKKYTSRSKMLEALEHHKHLSKHQYRPVQIKYS
jgi:hypothetical protein